MITSKKIVGLLIAISSFLFLLIAPTDAMTARNGSRIDIPRSETVHESIFLGGNAITVEGIVEGDLFCGGQDIEISGIVKGDVICGGQSVIISGKVGGNVRAAGQKLLINGTIDRNANLFGQSVKLGTGSAILGEAFVGSQSVIIDGSIAKQLSGGAQSISINGIVDTVNIETQNLALGSTAKINKNLTYISTNDATIATRSAVLGTIVKQTPAREKKQPAEQNKRVWKSVWTATRFATLLTQIILGLVILFFIPKQIKNASLTMQERVLPAFGYGLLLLFLVPVIMVIFVLTIIGIPAAILLLLLFMFSFLLSRIFVASVIGRILLTQFWAEKHNNDYWTISIGLFVLWLIFSIPVVGGILSFLSLLWGLGGTYYLIRPVDSHTKLKKTSTE